MASQNSSSFGDRLHDLDAGLGKVLATTGDMASAFIKVTGAVTGMVSQATKFVEAASPSAVLVLNQALYDLTGLIGQALTPVVGAAAQAVKLLGGTLAPVVRELTPVMQELTGSLLTLVEQSLPGLQALAGFFVKLATGAARLVEIFTPMVTVATALTNVFLDLVTGLLGWLGDLLGMGTGSVRWAMQEFAKGVLTSLAILSRAVYGFLGLAGGGSVLRSLIRSTAPKKVGENVEDITGTGVARDAKITNFQDYSRQVTQAALIAGSGAAPKKTDNAWLEDLHGTLKDIEEWQSMSGRELLISLKAWLLDDMPPRLAEAIMAALRSGGERLSPVGESILDKGPGGNKVRALGELFANLGARWAGG